MSYDVPLPTQGERRSAHRCEHCDDHELRACHMRTLVTSRLVVVRVWCCTTCHSLLHDA